MHKNYSVEGSKLPHTQVKITSSNNSSFEFINVSISKRHFCGTKCTTDGTQPHIITATGKNSKKAVCPMCKRNRTQKSCRAPGYYCYTCKVAFHVPPNKESDRVEVV
jgi:hypothetical protein